MSDKIQKVESSEIQATAEITPMTLIATAQSTGASIEQMSQLLDLQMRWETNEARKAYNDAFSLFKQEQIEILKDSTVDFTFNNKRTYYKHTSLAHVVNIVVPLLAKYGLSHTWETVQDSGHVSVTCKVSHRDGHSEAITLTGPYDTGAGKNSIQAIGSTVTYLQRYTLMSILGLASSSGDDDGTASERNPEDFLNDNQIADMTALIDEVRDQRSREDYTRDFCAWAGYSSMDDIPKVKYKHLMGALEKKRGAK